jgi:hypothetical protein
MESIALQFGVDASTHFFGGNDAHSAHEEE